MRNLIPLAVLASSVLGVFGAGAEVAELPAVRDNTLFEDAEGSLSNGVGASLFIGNTRLLSLRRGVVAFDIEAGLPDEELIINSVEIRLTVDKVPDGVDEGANVAAHRLEGDWGEGASDAEKSGAGADAEEGDATWLHSFFPDSAWTNLGGDFIAEPSAQTMVDQIGTYIWTGKGLVADVQGWIEDPATNFGWIFIGDETEGQSVRRYVSRENEEEASRPVLVIDFTRVVPVERVTWGRIKADHR